MYFNKEYTTTYDEYLEENTKPESDQAFGSTNNDRNTGDKKFLMDLDANAFRKI